MLTKRFDYAAIAANTLQDLLGREHEALLECRDDVLGVIDAVVVGRMPFMDARNRLDTMAQRLKSSVMSARCIKARQQLIDLALMEVASWRSQHYQRRHRSDSSANHGSFFQPAVA